MTDQLTSPEIDALQRAMIAAGTPDTVAISAKLEALRPEEPEYMPEYARMGVPDGDILKLRMYTESGHRVFGEPDREPRVHRAAQPHDQPVPEENLRRGFLPAHLVRAKGI